MKKVFLTLSLVLFFSANATNSLEVKPSLKIALINCNEFATEISGTSDHYDSGWQYWQGVCVAMHY